MMERSLRPTILMALALAAAAGLPVRAAVVRTYPVRHLNPDDAVMAVQVKLPGLRPDCRLMQDRAKDPRSSGIQGVILAECTTDAMFSKIEAALAAVDVAPPTQRFHVAVLGASRKEGTMPDLPPGEAKALADFRKVMTYKSFAVEAETVLQVNDRARMQLNNIYDLEVVLANDSNAGGSIIVRKFELRAAAAQVSKTGAQSVTTYIETSFSLEKGETIVLGTSVSDQQARVVLVTALP
jgi:hypothetical protein